MAAVAFPQLLIRPVLRGDLDAVNGLEKLCFKDPYPPYFIDRLAEANPETFLVAITDDALVGYAVVDRWSGHDHLISIAVHPNNRRGGFARRLLAALEERLEKGRLVRLEARKSNLPTIEFYRRQGFQETGVIEAYYSDGEDAVVMERNLRKEPGLST
jgi:ribosomal-protein-alanine N-acetyltransferase